MAETRQQPNDGRQGEEGPELEEKRTDVESSTVMETPNEKGEQFFDAQQEQEEAVPISNSTTERINDNAPKRPPLSQHPRTPTARASLQRMRTFPRQGIKRTATGAQASNDPHDPFQYTFDPLSSTDSDSDSSSSSEGEGDIKQERQLKHAQQRKQRNRENSAKSQTEKEEERQGRSYSRFAVGNDFLSTKGRVSKRDGRLRITISETANSGYVAKALGQSIRNHLNVPKRRKKDKRSSLVQNDANGEEDESSIATALPKSIPRPHLNIVIMVIGSRGDIQPFLQVGKLLKHKYGHRVRIASHPTFRDFVEKDAGLEFFSVGGDPSELMAFMVKNPGLIPSVQTVREGEIQRRRSTMATMFEGFWRACVNSTDNGKDKVNLRMMGDKAPFVADAIIANPPSMAHVHIAEKLGIPLHVMFTFPYTPTTAFPHPLANIKARRNNVDTGYVNFMSYPLVEMMTWQGLGDIVNKFRENTLGLEPVSSLWAPGALYRMRVPYTYLWSPSLVPKPEDWGPEIDLAGFAFLDLASDFTPPQDLSDFLQAGDAPVYVGFGSIVVDDPDEFTDLIFKAAELAGVRVLVNKGWGGLGHDNSNVPKNVFMLENTPHDWLFPRVKAVVHHGGAGTTAIGLKLGKPTMIVPFFGDQPFWGARVAEAKAGAHQCISYKKLTAERLAEGIKQCLTNEAQRNAQKIADSIAKEGNGAENAVKAFHRSLPMSGKSSMRCSILQDRVAVWRVKKSTLRLSSLAAEILNQQGKIQWSQLKLLRHYEWNDFDGPGGPFTGGAGALSSSLYEVGAGVGMVPMRIAKHMKEREELEQKKRERLQRREQRRRRRFEQQATGKQATGPASPSKLEPANDRPPNIRQETATTTASTSSPTTPEPLPKDIAKDLGSGLKRSGAALLTMPNDFSLAIAQGFHNAPRLYGDATVRKPIRITGFKSGCLAARKEFQYGVSDAWTGLVMQPKGDWEDGDTLPEKFMGLGTGFGKGLGGFVLKGVSSVVSPPAFVGQGVIKSMESWSRGPGSKAYIRRAHQIQGMNGLQALRVQEEEARPREPIEGSGTNAVRGSSDKQDLVRETETRVLDGWHVFEELWATAGAVNTGPAGKIRLRREKRRWETTGALENVDTAAKALRAVKEGKELEDILGRPKKSDGREIRDEDEDAEDVESEDDTQSGDERRTSSRGDVSENTVVATPEDDGSRRQGSAGAVLAKSSGDAGAFGAQPQAPAATV